MGISSVGLFLVQSGCSLTNLPVPLGVKMLALNSQNFYMYFVGVGLAYWAVCCGGKSVCMFVGTFRHPYVHLYVFW